MENEEFEATRKMMQLMYDYDNGAFFPFRELFMKNMLESVIILLLSKVISEEETVKPNRNHVQMAISYLEMKFKDGPTLEEVSGYVGLNKNYFSTLFRMQTGKSFVKYVIDLKLEYSKKLIRSSTMNEICFSSGFNSFSNFAREFKKKYNITPLLYRKKKKETAS